LSNQQIHHDGIFFPKVYTRNLADFHKELSPQNKHKNANISSYEHIKRSLSQNSYLLHGEAILEKINNELNTAINL
jgi:hypothetical protein